VLSGGLKNEEKPKKGHDYSFIKPIYIQHGDVKAAVDFYKKLKVSVFIQTSTPPISFDTPLTPSSNTRSASQCKMKVNDGRVKRSTLSGI
jgi:hypothetical protein